MVLCKSLQVLVLTLIHQNRKNFPPLECWRRSHLFRNCMEQWDGNILKYEPRHTSPKDPEYLGNHGIMEDTGMPVGLTFAGPAFSDNELARWGFDSKIASTKRLRQILGSIENPSIIPTLATRLPGAGELNAASGSVHLAIKACISVSSDFTNTNTLQIVNKQVVLLSLTVVVDGRYRIAFEKAIPVPTASERRCRLRSAEAHVFYSHHLPSLGRCCLRVLSRWRRKGGD